MDFSQLKKALAVKSSQVIIQKGTLTPNVDAFLKEFYRNQGIIVNSATRTIQGTTSVTVAGMAAIYNFPKAKFIGVFTLDRTGNAQAVMSFQLNGSKSSPKLWDFSMSFPNLPGFSDVTKKFNSKNPNSPVLKDLDLYYSYFVLSTQAGVTFSPPRKKLTVTLEKGLNFASKLNPTGVLGALEAILNASSDPTVSGTIYDPITTKSYPPLKFNQYPWDVKQPFPGILLFISLNITDQIGNMDITKVQYKIFTPTSSKWFNSSQKWTYSYLPVMAYSGDLAIPSAGMSMEIGSQKLMGTHEVLLNAQNIKGVTFNKLSQLADLGGGISWNKYLPKEVMTSLNKITSKLSLTQIGVDIFPKPGYSGISIPYTYFNIHADVKWSLWNGLFVLNGLDFRVLITDPFSNPDPSLTIISDVKIIKPTFEVQASFPDFMVYIELDDAFTVNLGQLLKKYVHGAPAPLGKTMLNIDSFVVNVDPGVSYSGYLTLAENPPFTLDVGKTPLTIKNVSLSYSQLKGQGVEGSFSGELLIGSDFELDTSFDLNGNFKAFASFPKVTLTQLLSALVNKPLKLPSGFDLTFSNSTVLVQKQKAELQFLFGTQLDTSASLAFELLKDGTTGEWGFAFGVELTAAAFSKLNGLSVMKTLTDFFQIQELILAVSSIDNPSFQFPDFSVFNNKKITGKKIDLPQQSGGLKPGFFAYSSIHFGGTGTQNMLKKFFGITSANVDVIVFVGFDPLKDAKIFFDVSAILNSKTTIDGQLGIEIINSEPAFFLSGNLVTELKGNKETFNLTLLVVPDGAFISGSMVGSGTIQFGVVQLANVSLEIGIDDVGIPSFGFACEIEANGAFDSSVAIFIDSTDPLNSMVAGSVSKLNLGDVLTVLSGGGGGVSSGLMDALKQIGIEGTMNFNIPASYNRYLNGNNVTKVAVAFLKHGNITLSSNALDTLIIQGKKSGTAVVDSWFLTDLTKMRHYQLTTSGSSITVSLEAQFQCVLGLTGVTIGSGIHYNQGIFVDCQIDFFSFKAALMVDIENSKGISLSASMTTMTIVSSDVFEITSASGHGGPYLSMSTFPQPSNPIKQYKSPHFILSGNIAILGLAKLKLFVSITKSGFIFHLGGKFLITTFNVDVVFTSITNFSANGSITVGVNKTFNLGAFGHLKVDIAVALVTAVIVNTSALSCEFDGSFEFEGFHVDIAKFSLSIHKQPFKNIGSTILAAMPKMLTHILASKCGMTLAFGLLIIAILSEAVDEVLHDLMKTPKGQKFAFHFYLHQKEIYDILEKRPDIVAMLKAPKSNMMEHFIRILEEVEISASDRLGDSIQWTIDELRPYKELTYGDFLQELDG